MFTSGGAFVSDGGFYHNPPDALLAHHVLRGALFTSGGMFVSDGGFYYNAPDTLRVRHVLDSYHF